MSREVETWAQIKVGVTLTVGEDDEPIRVRGYSGDVATRRVGMSVLVVGNELVSPHVSCRGHYIKADGTVGRRPASPYLALRDLPEDVRDLLIAAARDRAAHVTDTGVQS